MGRSEIQYSLQLVPQRSRGGGFTDRELYIFFSFDQIVAYVSIDGQY